jgi:transposase
VSADLVPDDLWERVAPLLPPRPPRRHRYPGRLPADDRAALRGIVYVLRKGVSRRDVPAERIGCSGVTSWRRLRDWTKPESGPACTKPCRRNCAQRACWRWTTPRSTARTSGLSKGGSHRTFAGRPGTPRQQTPHHRRPARNPARSHSDQRKPSRRHPSSCLYWTPYRTFVACAAGPGTGPGGCSPTAATTSTSTGASSGLAGSHPRPPVVAPRTAPDWARPDEPSSAPSPDCISSNGSASATKYAPTSTSLCSNPPAASSA